MKQTVTVDSFHKTLMTLILVNKLVCGERERGFLKSDYTIWYGERDGNILSVQWTVVDLCHLGSGVTCSFKNLTGFL